MNLSQNKKLMFIPITLIMLLGILYISEKQAYNETHELLHLKIAQNNGCVDWTINHNLKENNFQCHEYKDGFTHENEMLLHTLNEIVSYNVMSILNTLMFITVMLIVSLFSFTLMLKY
jgi:hypothetical protein